MALDSIRSRPVTGNIQAPQECDERILVISGYAERYLDNTKSLAETFGLSSVTTMTKPLEITKLEEFLNASN